MGNGMSLSVVKPLLRAALIATGVVHPSTPDRWATGHALARIIADAWDDTIPDHVLESLPARGALHVACWVRKLQGFTHIGKPYYAKRRTSAHRCVRSGG